VQPGDAAWDETLACTPHDVYHLAGYARASTADDHADIRGALVSDGARRLFVPLMVRPVPGDLGGGYDVFDAVSPYGYPGPIFSQVNDEERREFVDAAVSLLVDNLRRSGIVATFVRLHPLLGVTACDLEGKGALVHHGETVVVDLDQTEEELWRQTRSGHRNEINKSLRLGHVAEMDDSWQHLDNFIDIYRETMQRVGASEGYFFSEAYFRKLRDALSDHLHLGIVRVGDEIAAASLFTETGGIVQYHLSGTREAHLRAQPTKLLLHFARTWAKARGNRWMHLGGGLGGGKDSLFAFKAGFSKMSVPFHTWRVIADPAAYQRLVTAWEQRHGVVADRPDGFFPAYRKPE
jgi:hypothetical protein